MTVTIVNHTSGLTYNAYATLQSTTSTTFVDSAYTIPQLTANKRYYFYVVYRSTAGAATATIRLINTADSSVIYTDSSASTAAQTRTFEYTPTTNTNVKFQFMTNNATYAAELQYYYIVGGGYKIAVYSSTTAAAIPFKAYVTKLYVVSSNMNGAFVNGINVGQIGGGIYTLDMASLIDSLSITNSAGVQFTAFFDYDGKEIQIS